MKASRGLCVLVALALAGLAAAPAAGEFRGPQLSIVGDAPKPAVFKSKAAGAQAELGLTVRNDSSFRGGMRVWLVLDGGTTVRLRGKGAEAIVSKERITMRLRRRGMHSLRIGSRSVRRVRLQLAVEPAPKKTLIGTLVVAAGRVRSVSPATVRVTFQPKTAVPTTSRWAQSQVKPASVVVKVNRWLPSPIAPRALITDAQDVTVEDLGNGPAIGAGTDEAKLVSEPVSADTGGRGSVTLTAPHGITASDEKATIRLDAHRLTRHGTYETTVPLDADLEKSPTVTVKVLAQDLFIWPLLAIMAGSLLAWHQLRNEEKRRPKEVLKLALTKLKEVHDLNKQDTESPVPYPLDPFPDGGQWSDCTNPYKEAHKLYCRIDSASLKEELDDLTTEVSDLDTRVRAWPIARAKVKDLEAASGHLPEGPTAAKMRERCEAVGARDASPAGKEEANQYFQQIEEQIDAVATWLAISAMLEEALNHYATLTAAGDVDPDVLSRHNPQRWLPDLTAAASAADLERCGMVEGVCRDLHRLRSLLMTPGAETPPGGTMIEMPTIGSFMPDELVGPLVAPQIQSAGKVTPSSSVSDRLLKHLRTEDKRTFVVGFVLATLVYFLTIYDDTYGSVLQYLAAFAAGAGSTYAANFKLLPWFRSYRPPQEA